MNWTTTYLGLKFRINMVHCARSIIREKGVWFWFWNSQNEKKIGGYCKKKSQKDYTLQEVVVDIYNTFYGNFGKIGVNAGWSNIPLHGMMGEGEWLDHESLAFALLDKEIKGG